MGDILLCGDFNARVGLQQDYIAEDDTYFVPVHNDYPIDQDILTRESQDHVLDSSRGRDLIDICIGQQLRILNGRALGDMLGQYTCHTPNGSSTVDYVIVSEKFLDQVLFFRVTEFIPTLSDTHCNLEWAITARYKMTKSNNTVKIHQCPPNFIWDNESAEQFVTALSSNEIQTRLLKFADNFTSCTDKSQETASEAATEFSEIIISAATKSLKRKKLRKNKSKYKNKKWFTPSLRQMRFNLINYGKVFSKYPRDPQVRNHYYKMYREYTKARKKASKQYRQSILDQLVNLHDDNPKLYWQLIKDLKKTMKGDRTVILLMHQLGCLILGI